MHLIDGPSTLLFRFSIARLACVALVMVVMAVRFSMGLFNYDPYPLFYVLLGYAVVNSLFLMMSRPGRQSAYIQWAIPFQLLTDIAAVTLVVFFSGGIYSRWVFLYMIPAMSSMILPARHIMWTNLFIIILYGALAAGQEMGVVPVFSDGAYTQSELAVVKSLKVALTVGITSTLALLYSYIIRERGQNFLRAKLDLLFDTIEDLDRVSERLRQLESGIARAHSSELQDKVMDVRRELTLAIRTAQSVWEGQAAPGLVRTFNFFEELHCSSCRNRIKSLSFFYGLSREQREIQGYGPYRNDTHCAKCYSQARATSRASQ